VDVETVDAAPMFFMRASAEKPLAYCASLSVSCSRNVVPTRRPILPNVNFGLQEICGSAIQFWNRLFEKMVLLIWFVAAGFIELMGVIVVALLVMLV